MTMILYDWPNSYNSKKILAIAFETGQFIKLHPVDMAARQHKNPDFLSMNPNGKVPLLVDGNFHLWESDAVACYVAAKDPSRRLLPADPRQRALIDQWLFWQTAELSSAIEKITFEHYWKRALGLGAADELAVSAARPEVDRLLGILDSQLTTHQWVAGDLSVADFSMAAVLMIANAVNINTTAWTNIQAWLGRIEARSSWQHASKIR
jgi:glutathione S-transferase